MKKFIALLALVLVSASTMMYAQESNAAIRRADRKAERDAERAKLRAEEQVQDMAAYQQAVQALKNKQFVLEANQVIFRNGMSSFVTSNTNFVLMNGNRRNRRREKNHEKHQYQVDRASVSQLRYLLI